MFERGKIIILKRERLILEIFREEKKSTEKWVNFISFSLIIN